MTPDFNRVVIRNRTQDEKNIHLAVHPFKCDGLRQINVKGDYTDIFKGLPPDWMIHLADDLWDGIPGLARLFFSNGQITIQHTGTFDDKEIIEAAKEIIEPFLTEQLTLDCVYADVALNES